jgi:Uma2 family endonuclease
MPTAVTDTPAQLGPRRKVWTRSEVDALSSSGLFDGQHLELIEGELIDKMGKKWPHIRTVAFLYKWLMRVFDDRLVYQEPSIDVAPQDNPTNEPEPDLIVLKRVPSHFTTAIPCSEDLQLVIEVSDSTVGFDIRTKAALYARAGIVEYWVLDIPGRRIIVHRDPQSGRYASVAAYTGEESVAPLAAPESYLKIRDAFEQ